MYLVEKGFYADDVSRQSSRGGTDWWNLCQQAHTFLGLQTPCDVMSLLIQTTPWQPWVTKYNTAMLVAHFLDCLADWKR